MSNPHESELGYPFGEALPARGEAIEVAPGVRWVRMGLPFALDHVNLWLLRDRDEDGRDGWAIVDCGVHDEATRAAWEAVFEQALDGLPVLRVLVTHMHPDHIGLADWLCRRWSTPGHECRLWISATDYHVARAAGDPSNPFGGEAAAAHYARHGLADADALKTVAQRSGYYKTLVPAVPARFRRLLDGGTVRVGDHDWHCHAGYGHAPEHIALHAPGPGVLIAGDMVLPRISTNVSVVDVEPEADPLTLYLDSIERMRAIDADVLVLPSHGLPFKGLHARIDQLQAHHADRFAEVLEACAKAPLTAFQLVPVLFKRALDLHQMTFAMGESIAHCHALWQRGLLLRLVGGDGRIRFAAPA